MVFLAVGGNLSSKKSWRSWKEEKKNGGSYRECLERAKRIEEAMRKAIFEKKKSIER